MSKPLFPNPFDELGPDPRAREAAESLLERLRRGVIAPGLPSADALHGEEGGKMFGVLLAEAKDGTLHTLHAFSGMLFGCWNVEGFVPPLFDAAERARLELPGEAKVKAVVLASEAFRSSPLLSSARVEDEAQQERHRLAQEALRARHASRRQARKLRRSELQTLAQAGRSDRVEESRVESSADTKQRRLDSSADTEQYRLPSSGETERAAALHALAQESRADKAEQRRLDALQQRERAALAPACSRLERRLRAFERLRGQLSRALMRRLHDTYLVPNARGDRWPLRSLFSEGEPPSGAGDCAAPKLLAQAYSQGLRPLALAELWWGAPPKGGGRVSGAFYPACKNKCGPLLPYMMEGLSAAPRRAFELPTAPGDGALDVLFEDAWVVVLHKPDGLLSVPGREQGMEDSVLSRLRARYPGASGPMIVHRLDLDTSGLMVAALDAPTHTALQRQFLRREVFKRYVAVLDGDLKASGGTVSLPLRVDLEDRPRQLVDPLHGKTALTEWEALARGGGRTRVVFLPHTGRTHQLRVHAAHPLGLGAPIVGDRLYGHPGERLHLHAERLGFTHPVTQRRMQFERPAPF